MTNPIKLLIVDDHPLFRQGLVDVLDTDPDIYIVAEAVDGEDALEKTRLHRPDIVIMDVNLPGGNGLQVTRHLLGEFPETRVIILTGYDNTEQIFHSLQIGAVAYCSKDIPPDDLLKAIHAVYEGLYFVQGKVMTSNEALGWLQQRATRYTSAPQDLELGPMASLSPREMEILELVTRGISNKDIAQQLGISQQTVKNHVTAVLRKLQVHDRTQAAIYALRHGWVRLEG